jgi:hypothetical protein
MDPNVVYSNFSAAMLKGNKPWAQETYWDLYHWIEKGGFRPKNMSPLEAVHFLNLYHQESWLCDFDLEDL